MSQTPNQKNIIHGSITAGENIHIGDKITHIINQQKLEIPVRLTNFIPTDASHVVGRYDELAETHQKLSNNKPTVLVNGIGGIGKTTLALKYMVAYTPQYQHVAWLNAAVGVQSAFIQDTALLDALHLRRDVEDSINAAQPDKAFDLVFKRLNDLGENTEGGKKILVVLDNANELADLLAHKKYFDTTQIHFLITSRANPEGWQIVKVESLPKEQALELFKNIYPSVSASNEALDTVLSQLFYHTLLIELVAKAAKANAMDFDRLSQAINDKFIHDPDLQKRKVNVENHSITIGEEVKRAKIEEYIWLIFKNVKDLPDSAKEMLRAFALLPPATPFDEDFLSKHFALWQITDDVYDILDISLVERGWLDKNGVSYSMHPLVAEVVVKHLEVSATFAEKYILNITELIYYDNTNPKHHLLKINQNKSYAERLSHLFFDENTEKVSDLLIKIGFIEENFGFYEKAAHYTEKALEIAETILDKEHATISSYRSCLSNIYSGLGRYEDAAKLAIDALENSKNIYEKDHIEIVVLQSNLAVIYRHLGRYPEAANLLETALASAESTLEKDHPMIPRCQSNLANIYNNLERYSEAAELLEKALVSIKKNFAEDHPSILISQANLGEVYRNLERYEEAAKLLEAALASNIKVFGKDHFQVARCQSNLSTVYFRLKRYSEVSELLEAALASNLKNFEEDHPEVATKQWNLAVLYITIDRKKEAKTLLQKAHGSFLKRFGEEHPYTVKIKTWFSKAE